MKRKFPEISNNFDTMFSKFDFKKPKKNDFKKTFEQKPIELLPKQNPVNFKQEFVINNNIKDQNQTEDDLKTKEDEKKVLQKNNIPSKIEIKEENEIIFNENNENNEEEDEINQSMEKDETIENESNIDVIEDERMEIEPKEKEEKKSIKDYTNLLHDFQIKYDKIQKSNRRQLKNRFY
jgi:CO dehydrogenase/acetyl-CoA synthase beta subunit